MCTSSAHRGFIVTLFWLGWTITNLWSPKFGEKWGRKKLVKYNNFVSLILYFGTIFAKDIYVLMLVVFIQGLLNMIRSSVQVTYITELMPKKHQTIMGAV